jgi:hypothetical protein
MRPKIEDNARRVPLSTTVAPVTDRRIKAACKRMNLNKGQLIDRLLEQGRGKR